jgi:group I intron endonuclease
MYIPDGVNTNCGIYRILNTRNGKFYIGSTKNAVGRQNSHFKSLAKGKHHCQYLQRAWNIEADKSVFVFHMFIYCNESDLKKLEQKCFDTLMPEYNVSLIADRPEMNEFTKRRISEGHLRIPEDERSMIAREREAAKTFEEKESHRISCRDAAKNRYDNADESALEEWALANSLGQKRYWANLSNSVRRERTSLLVNFGKAYWDNPKNNESHGEKVKEGLAKLSVEVIRIKNEKIGKATHKRWTNATEEQLKNWSEDNRRRAKNYWDKMSEADYAATCDSFSAGQFKRWENSTEEDRQAHSEATSRGRQKTPPEERSAASKKGWETRRRNKALRESKEGAE